MSADEAASDASEQDDLDTFIAEEGPEFAELVDEAVKRQNAEAALPASDQPPASVYPCPDYPRPCRCHGQPHQAPSPEMPEPEWWP